ncbi:hypothetical protein, partial [Rahnella sp. NRRL B-41462]|uniref:hypothetical protein n=1 Tax=Rahnella sp. NRRL B-41462 TaxID=1610579 RepID=UPI001E4F7916
SGGFFISAFHKSRTQDAQSLPVLLWCGGIKRCKDRPPYHALMRGPLLMYTHHLGQTFWALKQAAQRRLEVVLLSH